MGEGSGREDAGRIESAEDEREALLLRALARCDQFLRLSPEVDEALRIMGAVIEEYVKSLAVPRSPG